MRRKIPKHLLFPAVLIGYVSILGIMSYPRYKASGNWSEYFTVIGITVLLALLLHLILKRRQKIRDQFTKKD